MRRHPHPEHRLLERLGAELEVLLEGHEREPTVVGRQGDAVHRVSEVHHLGVGPRQPVDGDAQEQIAGSVVGTQHVECQRGRLRREVHRPDDAFARHELDAALDGLAQQRPDVGARVERDRRHGREVRRAARSVPCGVVDARQDALVLGEQPDAGAPLRQGVVPGEGAVPRPGAGPPRRAQSVTRLREASAPRQRVRTGRCARATRLAIDRVDEEPCRHEVAARLRSHRLVGDLDGAVPHVPEQLGPVHLGGSSGRSRRVGNRADLGLR